MDRCSFIISFEIERKKKKKKRMEMTVILRTQLQLSLIYLLIKLIKNSKTNESDIFMERDMRLLCTPILPQKRRYASRIFCIFCLSISRYALTSCSFIELAGNFVPTRNQGKNYYVINSIIGYQQP
jgi:hypothetical protein